MYFVAITHAILGRLALAEFHRGGGGRDRCRALATLIHFVGEKLFQRVRMLPCPRRGAAAVLLLFWGQKKRKGGAPRGGPNPEMTLADFRPSGRWPLSGKRMSAAGSDG